MSDIPFLDLTEQGRSLRPAIDRAFAEILDSGWFVRGPNVEAFEAAFAAFCGARHALGVNSGTTALQIALMACGIGPGDEVITVSHTFAASVAGIIHAGATPVLVDVKPDTYTMDADRIEERITDRTRAILPVHLYGQPADMDPIVALAAKYGLRVIEDAAQAHGATYAGRPVGSLGDVACFSFYPGKNLGAYGEGGAVVTSDDEIAHQARLLHNHGAETKYEHIVVGYNFRMEALQGAVLGAKLPHLSEWNRLRQERASWYDEGLAEADVVTPKRGERSTHVYHLYVIQAEDRDGLQADLGRQGIGTGIHYPIPVHLQPGYAQLGYGRGDLPVTEHLADHVLSLPMYPELSRDGVERVVEAVTAACPGKTAVDG